MAGAKDDCPAKGLVGEFMAGVVKLQQNISFPCYCGTQLLVGIYLFVDLLGPTGARFDHCRFCGETYILFHIFPSSRRGMGGIVPGANSDGSGGFVLGRGFLSRRLTRPTLPTDAWQKPRHEKKLEKETNME